MNASNWAFYLGHHWSYRREIGEPQLTFNWCKTFSDFLTNFALTNGVVFQSPHATQAIVPELLRTVWEEHQPQGKDSVLWEMMQQGSVSGDCFTKIAFEDGYQDPAGGYHPPKIRILPLNAAFCLTPDTEILTKRGWLSYDQLTDTDEALSLHPERDEIVWTPVQQVNIFDWDGPLAKWENERFSVMSTPDHRWVHQSARGKRTVRRTHELHDLKGGGVGQLVVAGGTPLAFASAPKWDDDFVEMVGWFVTEGHWHLNGVPMFTQSEEVNPEEAARIDRVVKTYDGSTYRHPGKATQWYVPNLQEAMLDVVGNDKQVTPEFLCSLTYAQARLLYETMLDGDGHRGATTTFAQSDSGRMDGFQMLAAMLGLRTQARWRQREIGKLCGEATVYKNRTLNLQNLERTEEHYEGKVWCPTTGTGTWLARRKGTTFWTGNCFPEYHPHDMTRLIRFKMKYRFWGTALEGTRQVFSFTELWTEDSMQSFINDEMVESQDNPLGMIPFVHISNTRVPSSPWGLSDIQDITDLNRQYNETATLMSDIINYYASPTTVILGAKANNLERGPKKVWAIPNDKARIENLSLGAEGQEVLAYMSEIKGKMHEIVGIPVNALGEPQAISNTSGVALSLQFLPLLQRFRQKTTQYASGLAMLNELIIRTAALYMPEMLQLDPTRDAPLEEGQLDHLDPADPLTYRNTVQYASPLPIDKLIALNEIQMEMGLGLESKRGALRKLGEAYPAEKLEELLNELHEDALEQGALDLINTQIKVLIEMLTGQQPGDEGAKQAADEGGVQSAGGPGVNTAQQAPAPDIANDPALQQTMNELTTLAAGTKIPQVRNPNKLPD